MHRLLLSVVEDGRSCTVAVSNQPIHISGRHLRMSTSHSGCGSRNTPWRLEALVGQRIRVSVLDFADYDDDATTLKSSSPVDVEDCRRQFGYILDRPARKNISVCGVKERTRPMHDSKANVLELILAEHSAESFNYLLRFEGFNLFKIIIIENNVVIIRAYTSLLAEENLYFIYYAFFCPPILIKLGASAILHVLL